tara:strand:+ start:501 stop:1235 length:735 start_codon:yes stop_codon:yes gene_type:complete
VRNNTSFLNVYKKKSSRSEVVTQLLYGDTFKKIKKTRSWIKIKNNLDNYTGYIKNRKFPSDEKNSHKVFSLSSNLYSKPNYRKKTGKKISFGSRVKIIDKKNGFYRFDNFWIKKKDLKKINYKTKDIFENIYKFVNVKYKWGGKHFSGMDCSAIIQLCLNFNNKYCPRDTKDQIRFFKKNVKIEKIKKNDLIFWKGHVALIISKKKVIHGYGPFKKVVIMPLKRTIDRIYKTANLKVTAVKRIV